MPPARASAQVALCIWLFASLAACQLSDQTIPTASGIRATLLRAGGGVEMRLNGTTSERVTAQLARIVEVDELGYELPERTIDNFAIAQPTVTSGEAAIMLPALLHARFQIPRITRCCASAHVLCALPAPPGVPCERALRPTRQPAAC